MVFSSVEFLFFFLPISFLIYYGLVKWGNQKTQNSFLLIISLLFYAYGEPKYIIVMLFSIIINYFMGKIMNRQEKGKKILLFIAVVINLGILFCFKYLSFTINNINAVFGVSIKVKEISLPIGISFYTFQILTYLIDVYRGKVAAQKNIISFALYVSFFPQLIAGPIVQYSNIYEQIQERTHTLEKIEWGGCRFIIGLSKKVLLANQLGQMSDLIMGASELRLNYIGTANAWLGIICYALQIYFDFSGYSDMAIGLASMFGFRLSENFKYPYTALSVRDFWRRWHISLSSFFRDYVYIPLGGNRKHLYLNLFIVFFLTGLWHGASWTFVVWGLWHGMFMIVERLLGKRMEIAIPVWLKHIYTMLVVTIGWVFFRMPTIKQAMSYIKVMFRITYQTPAFGISYYLNRFTILILIAGIVAATLPLPIISKQFSNSGELSLWKKGICLVLLIICGMFLQASSYNPFIYFQF